MIEHFAAARDAFTRCVHTVAANQWTMATPDSDWTVADLVGHLVIEHRWAGPLLDGDDLTTAARRVEDRYGPLGTDLAASWDEACAASTTAFTAPDALSGRVALNRGWAPAIEYVEEMIFDLVVHAWDLATAITTPPEFPADLVRAMSELADAVVDRTPAGMFAPPVAVPADATVLEQVLARAGRDPRSSGSPGQETPVGPDRPV